MKFKFGKNFLILASMTLIIVFLWIGFEVYRSYTETTIPKVITELIKPLSPAIDLATIEDIEKRYQISTEELNKPIETISTPETETEEEATPSQTATESGNLEEE